MNYHHRLEPGNALLIVCATLVSTEYFDASTGTVDLQAIIYLMTRTESIW